MYVYEQDNCVYKYIYIYSTDLGPVGFEHSGLWFIYNHLYMYINICCI